MKSLTEALAEFVRDEVVLDDLEIGVDTDLLLSGSVDSLGIIRITHWIEEEAGFVVDPGDVTLENFQTITKICEFIDARSGP